MLTYKTKTLQVRVTDDEFARLEKIAAWFNNEEWSERRARRDSYKIHPAFGYSVTRSDVIRWLIKHDQVDVLQKDPAGTGRRSTSSRSRKRTTKPSRKRTTATR